MEDQSRGDADGGAKGKRLPTGVGTKTYSQTDALSDFTTYEEYLDSFVHPKDLYYLEDENLARELVELGCRGSGEILSRDDFYARKRLAETVRTQKHTIARKLASIGREKDVAGSPLLRELAEREEAVRSGRLMCILFIRGVNKKGQEISGFIDYAHRLKTDNFESYFSRRKKLLPRPSDLSFYNWETQVTSSNHTPNFQVISGEKGILFKNKRDRKVINVDPESPPGESSATKRIDLTTTEYLQVVIFDHVTRQKL
eukprot:m51a1_g14573 hypothetical protein (257) ;mRNA; f:1072627-1073545